MQYRTLTPIRHDGFDIQIGEVVDIDPQSAKALLDSQSIEPVHKPFAAKLSPIAREPGNG